MCRLIIIFMVFMITFLKYEISNTSWCNYFQYISNFWIETDAGPPGHGTDSKRLLSMSSEMAYLCVNVTRTPGLTVLLEYKIKSN